MWREKDEFKTVLPHWVSTTESKGKTPSAELVSPPWTSSYPDKGTWMGQS
jgi:hypothetical protein